MTDIVELISNDNSVFRAYAFWSAILILKMLAMSFLTGQQRKKKQVIDTWEVPCKMGQSKAQINLKCHESLIEPFAPDTP